MAQERPTGFKLYVMVAYMSLMVIYGFYLMITAIIAYSNFARAVTLFQLLADNFAQDPIVDVVYVPETPTAVCPRETASHTYAPLFNYAWQGLGEGCDCRTATASLLSKYHLSSKLYTSSCTTNMTKASCDKIKATPEQTLIKWTHPTHSTISNLFCVKRLRGYNWKMKPPLPPSNTAPLTCPSDTELCIGSDNKIDQAMCVPKVDQQVGANCPIRSISVTTTLTAPSPGNVPGANLQVQFSKTTPGSPICELRLVEGSVVCELNTDQPISTGRRDYELQVNRRSTCKPDPRFFEITSPSTKVTEKDFFNINGITYMTLGIPASDWESALSSVYTYGNFYRGILPWQPIYRQDLTRLLKLTGDIDNMKGFQLVVMLINILACIFISIVLQISQVYVILGKDVPCIGGTRDQEAKKVAYYKGCLKYGFKLLQAPFIIAAFVISAGIRKFITSVADSKPSDDLSNTVLATLANLVEEKVFRQNLNMIISLAVMLAFDLIALIKQKFCYKQDNSSSIQPIGQEQPVKQELPNMQASIYQPLPSVIQNPGQQPVQMMYGQPQMMYGQPVVYMNQPPQQVVYMNQPPQQVVYMQQQ